MALGGDFPSDAAWAALRARADWPGIYGVVSTGIYCRPGCPARTPLRKNVRMFGLPDQARAAGFRACKRCGGGDASPMDKVKNILKSDV